MKSLALPNQVYQSTAGPLSLAGIEGPIVLYFYLRDATSGCATEAGDFNRLFSKFKTCGARVLGVSRDSLKSHDRFKQNEGLKFDLVSDPEEQLCRHFGVLKTKTMYGKPVRGIERSTFVFNANHELVREWRGVKVPGHAAEVLAELETLL